MTPSTRAAPSFATFGLALWAALVGAPGSVRADPIGPNPRSPPPVARELSATPTSDKALQQQLDQLAKWVARERGELSALVVELETGRVLAGKNEALPLNPASNAKLLTAAAALAALGSSHRFTTGVYGVIQDGVASRLVLRSDGDPSLGNAELARLAKQLADAGLRRVTGDLLVDQSAFDAQFVPPSFDQQPNEWAPFRAPVSAVPASRNVVVVRVTPGEAGKDAQISVEPAGSAELDGRVKTEKRGKGRKLSLGLAAKDGRLRVSVSGFVSAGTPTLSFPRRADDPRLLAGWALAAALRKHGVALEGAVREGGRDEKARLIEQQSEPLVRLLHQLGKHSDNFTAEMLLKALGAKTSGRAGRSADGAAAVESWMRSVGALESGTRVGNGSGLFDANRVSARALVAALRAVHRDDALREPFLEQLAVGGVDGTLKNRFRGPKLRQRVRAKTGTLARAHTLSGFVLGSQGTSAVAFAILVNGVAGKADEHRRRIDRVVERIVLSR